MKKLRVKNINYSVFCTLKYGEFFQKKTENFNFINN